MIALMLLIAGVLQLAGAIALLILSNYNPVLLFIGSAACVFLALARRSDVLRDLRLLIAGLLLLAGAVVLMMGSDFNPAALFAGGGICAFLGFAQLRSPSGGRGDSDSAGDLDNTSSLLSDGQ